MKPSAKLYDFNWIVRFMYIKHLTVYTKYHYVYFYVTKANPNLVF